MNLLGTVDKIMSKELFTLESNASIAQAAKLFEMHKIHHIPVVDNGKLIGMVSKTDYLFFRRGFLDNREDEQIEEVRMNNYTVSFIMTTALAKIEPDTKINVVLEIFKENLFHAIPVVEDDQLVGLVTTYDIIKQLANDQKAYTKYD